MPRKAMPDVVVCLPGIMGSVLRKDGRDLWNVSGGAVLHALATLGHSLDDLLLRDDPVDVDDLGDGITAPEVIRDVHLIPGLWKIDGYTKLLDHIESTFDVQRGQNLFEFPYDWRRDNRVAARRLDREARVWLERWRESRGAADARLVLVGHSMGGLIARHFLECLDGWRITRTLVTFGTPYRGSLDALATLVNGKDLGFVDLTPLVRSFTSVHQLLPTYPCYDGGGGTPVRVDEAAIPHLDPAHATAALDFHRAIAAAVDAHRDDEAYLRGGYDLERVVGIKQPTLQAAVRDGDGIRLARTLLGEDPGGDGTVPRPSATPLEHEDDRGATYSAERHASLQNDDHVLLQLTGILTGNAIAWSHYRGVVPMIDLGLDAPELTADGEPLVVRARPDQDPPDALLAVLVDVQTGAEIARRQLARREDGWHDAEFSGLPRGVYRVTVFGSGAVEPVTDLVTVL